MTRSIDASKYDTDKTRFGLYEEYLQPLLNRDVRLLELGVYKGGSLLLWRDYFERGIIVGLDLRAVDLNDPTGRIRLYQGRQQDKELLTRIAKDNAPDGFDVIIDDCSHIGEHTRISFWHLFDHHLKPGGIYVIEDWGTGYWERWYDGVRYKARNRFRPHLLRTRLISAVAHFQYGKFVRRIPLLDPLLHMVKLILCARQFHRHNYGMVGFVKELVDECAMEEITDPVKGVPPSRPSKFKEMRIGGGRVFIVKADKL